MTMRLGTRLAAGTFLAGMSLAGPQAMGLATADTGDAGSVGASAAATSSATQARSAKAPASRLARRGADSGRSAASAAASAAAARSSSAQPSAKPAGLRPASRSALQSASLAALVQGTSATASPLVSALTPPPVTAAPTAAAVGYAPPVLRAPEVRHALVGLNTVAVGLADTRSNLVSGLPAGPLSDLLSGALLLARRTAVGQGAVVAAATADAAAVTALDPNQHVLLIGVDGTNLSAILSDPYNQAFFDLMDTGTTAVATMVGHTTISNPSWTGILTGVWSETAGVSNNVFTPWTYDTWPTVFNQLEGSAPSIATTVVADWEVIAQIAGAGSAPADTIVFYPKINDSWEQTDDAVGDRSIQAIQNTVAGTPSFQMTYFVGVDNAGHDNSGAGSPEYAAALRNVNDNIANIMAEVDAWETANPGEQWTVIAVTDHGQMLNPLWPGPSSAWLPVADRDDTVHHRRRSGLRRRLHQQHLLPGRHHADDPAAVRPRIRAVFRRRAPDGQGCQRLPAGYSGSGGVEERPQRCDRDVRLPQHRDQPPPQLAHHRRDGAVHRLHPQHRDSRQSAVGPV